MPALAPGVQSGSIRVVVSGASVQMAMECTSAACEGDDTSANASITEV